LLPSVRSEERSIQLSTFRQLARIRQFLFASGCFSSRLLQNMVVGYRSDYSDAEIKGGSSGPWRLVFVTTVSLGSLVASFPITRYETSRYGSDTSHCDCCLYRSDPRIRCLVPVRVNGHKTLHAGRCTSPPQIFEYDEPCSSRGSEDNARQINVSSIRLVER
jgi:hypothetical protein